MRFERETPIYEYIIQISLPSNKQSSEFVILERIEAKLWFTAQAKKNLHQKNCFARRKQTQC